MVTKGADQVGETVSILDKIEIRLRTLQQQRNELLQEIYEIERLGWVDAKPYYRDGKYLYLIYPMTDGERKREYIGGDPEKIEEALSRIERKGRYDELSSRLATIDHAYNQVRYYLVQAIGACNW